MKLNIYGKVDGKKQIVKTYETTEYDLMFGTIEDLLETVDIGSIGEEITDEAILKIVGGLMINSAGTVKMLLMDMFEGITEDEIKNTTVKEVARVFVDVIIYTITQLTNSFAWGGQKNVKAAKSR